jgi:four helix bundle protein
MERKGELRFQNLEIRVRAISLADWLFDVADRLEKQHLYRVAEQHRGAGLSIPNNIAEGAGRSSNREFGQFLNFARRSVFEVANMLFVFMGRGLIERDR